ncbi:quinolinate synthase [Natronospira proteinivora]|uniref:Quinolinate synthase n=1 Tax=Natronospira proteinivora TaxID=1807133 RepID=A0ABT1G792_9GAMM|nr:quinolinate synthase NadA [Natronospira proteinivora]MCP1727170.1 quinolinate synthase [Natronospira proteinivora]
MSDVHKQALPEATPELLESLKPVYEKVRHVIPEVEWAVHAPYVARINELKKTRNAAILAHNYQTPDIFYGVADITGDSLGLARDAAKVDADVIVQCGVHFMAETSKILAPEKTILLPDMDAGCSLAEGITGADVRLLKERYPGVPVVVYVNTSAEVKAEADICCTSSNAVEVVESLGTDRVIFAPDKYLGQWVASQTNVEIILYEGSCEVHERFTGKEIESYRQQHPGIYVLAHPECPQDVLKEADYVGSTGHMIKHLDETRAKQVVMITECSMSDNVAAEHPEKDFIRPCNLCPHMQRITLPKILQALENMAPEVTVPEKVIAGARDSLQRMLEVGKKQAA